MIGSLLSTKGDIRSFCVLILVSDGIPIRIDVVLDVPKHVFLLLGHEQMPKPSLGAQIFFNGAQPIRNQCMSHFAVDRFL